MTTLRIDRLETMVGAIVQQLDAADLGPMLPPALQAMDKLTRGSITRTLKDAGLSSMRHLPSAARSDSERADRVAAYVVHLVAWLTDQTDVEPPPITI
jgi:hypothetical protein